MSGLLSPPLPISIMVGDFQATGGGGGVLTESISQVRHSILGTTLKEVLWGKGAEDRIDMLKALSLQNRRC